MHGALLKLDFQKAYDSVNWSFLRLVMVKLGFGNMWINWIMNCVSLASMSILLNGSPLKPFKMEKGLRKGDPLSPYLFILVTEVLVVLLNKAQESNLIAPLEIGKNKVWLKLLQSAKTRYGKNKLFSYPRCVCVDVWFELKVHQILFHILECE